VRFILDHIGKPAIRAGLPDPYRNHIKELAELPKLSGVITEADHQSWTPAQLRPYLAHVIDSFGFERLMYASDWPVSRTDPPLRRVGRDPRRPHRRLLEYRGAKPVPR
jgi:L-fuconolactonase